MELSEVKLASVSEQKMVKGNILNLNMLNPGEKNLNFSNEESECGLLCEHWSLKFTPLKMKDV